MSAIFDEDHQHTDPLTDTLLIGGKIYIGTAGLDPIVNPINVFDNRELTGSPLGQPVIIGMDGRAANKIWVSGKYSFQIDSSADVLKYQELDNGFDESVGNIQTSSSLGINDITVTGIPTQSAYTDNKTYIVTAPADNTGAMTINIDSIGVIDIRKAHDQAIVSGDVKADMKLQLIYNLTDDWMELQSAVLGSVFGGDIIVAGDVTGLTFNATGDTSVGDNAAMGFTATEGVIITGQGSTYDVTIKNDADADVIRIPTGTQTIDIPGGQLTFPASQSPSANANTLDDYQEGEFQVTFAAGTSGTITVDTSKDTLAFTKIGRVCHVQGQVTISSVSSPVGNCTMSGMPFASASLGEESEINRHPIMCINLGTSADGFKPGVMTGGTSTIVITDVDSTALADDVVASTSFTFNFSYITA